MKFLKIPRNDFYEMPVDEAFGLMKVNESVGEEGSGKEKMTSDEYNKLKEDIKRMKKRDKDKNAKR